MSLKVGLLAIGNEVVDGQILNCNSAWISSQANLIGCEVSYHLSCRDKEEEIIQSLNFLSHHCDMIISTGGLGPTRDDCTRAATSQWLNQKLEFKSELWQEIEKKILSRNIAIREGHRKQAFVPSHAIPMKNNRGVAPGFFVHTENKNFAALPGPPAELHPMWKESLAKLITTHLKPQAKRKLHTWILMGAPESEVAHIAESIFEKAKDIELGFRIHKPYVELKVWTQTFPNNLTTKLFESLEQQIQPWLVSRSLSEIRCDFSQAIRSFQTTFMVDHLSFGLMLDRLKEGPDLENFRYQCFSSKIVKTFSLEKVKEIVQHMQIQSDQLFLGLFPHNEKSVIIALGDEQILFEIPRNFPLNSQIGKLFSIETLFLKVIKKYGTQESCS